MHRVDTDGHVGNLFDEGDPGVPRLPTQIDSEILNAFQEELANTIEGGGVTLVKNTNTQLRDLVLSNSVAERVKFGFYSGLQAGYAVQNAVWTGSQWNRVDSGRDAFLFVFGNFNSAPGFAGTGFSILVSPSADGDTNLTFKLEWDTLGAGRGPLVLPDVTAYSAWAATAQNGWAATGGTGTGSWKDAQGYVCLQGAVTGGTSGQSCGTLPVHHRPAIAKVFTAVETGTGTLVRVVINTDGTVVPTGANTNVYLDGIRFR